MLNFCLRGCLIRAESPSLARRACHAGAAARGGQAAIRESSADRRTCVFRIRSVCYLIIVVVRCSFE
eukprot:510134-Pyramimonas_sp.AAC.1